MRKSENSIANRVRTRIENGGQDRLWTYSDFPTLPSSAVAAALSRLTKKGVIRRVRKGVYYVPRETRFGTTTPNPASVAAAVLKRRGVAWKPSGLPAYNSLGLTTQVSPVMTFDVERDVASLRTGLGHEVRLRIVPELKNITTDERVVLDALRDLRVIPDTSAANTLSRILHLFRSGRLSFERVANAARKEPPRVRAVVGLIGTKLNEDPNLLAKLKNSLNPITTFKLGLAGDIPEARQWQIR